MPNFKDGKRMNVYKEDNWNQMNIHAHGRRFVVSEISSIEGEHTYDFTSRQEMISWAQRRFAADNFSGTEEERQEILSKFKKA
ncbi:hypothetical protein [Tumebacillus flagellatus]|uniref:Uncharacterized protein n=1 Tax=Tumebacillus flagellatus TaxID=1157490 RepID=A0A074LJ07_9BACL|nr:hypothetical protein [Tumebacillus flagellatus]KEO82146.1 hypothetical protein EL26_17125 [Tumebacillus flagellatus]